jgi:hypothetical protein
MGTPLHPRPGDEPGEPCIYCEAMVWGEAHTPKTCRIVFHNIIPTGSNPAPPNNLPITSEQVTGAPCNYEGWITFGGYNWQARYYSVTGLVTLTRINGVTDGYFWGYFTPCMAGPFPNDFPIGEGYAGGGSAFVLDLPLDYVLTTAFDEALGTDTRLLYDDKPAADPDNRCLRFTGRDSPGCCWILKDITA